MNRPRIMLLIGPKIVTAALIGAWRLGQRMSDGARHALVCFVPVRLRHSNSQCHPQFSHKRSWRLLNVIALSFADRRCDQHRGFGRRPR
jgi:hypothetical protein